MCFTYIEDHNERKGAHVAPHDLLHVQEQRCPVSDQQELLVEEKLHPKFTEPVKTQSSHHYYKQTTCNGKKHKAPQLFEGTETSDGK